MSDETNRAVQPPTHAVTAVIYGDDASGMKNRASRRRVCLRRPAPVADRSALLKQHYNHKALLQQQPCPMTQDINDRQAAKLR